MKAKKNLRVAALFSALILALVLGLSAGCSKNKPAAAPSSSSPYGTEDLKELKASASHEWVWVALEKGWLNEIFEQHGIKVTLVQGTTGNETQLMSRKDLHFANRMLYPYMLYRTQGANLMAVNVSAHPATNIASVYVLKESPVQTFDDLKGKKIASWRAGCPYMVLYEIAERRNWVQGKDWHYINIPQGEQKNALMSHEVDAVSSHLSGDVAPLLINGIAREVAYPAEDSIYVNGGGVTVTFTTAEFAATYPKITKAYIDLQTKTQLWMLDNLDEAAKLVENVTRVPAEITKFGWLRRAATFRKSSLSLENIIKETKIMQDWLEEHGDIDAARHVNTADLFDPQYF